jgi:cardiolipin synthase
VLAGCTAPDDLAPLGEEIPDEPLFILMDAFQGNQQYFLRYRRAENIYYAAGNLRTQVPASPEEELVYDIPTVEPMESVAEATWESLTQSMRRIPILQVAEWGELRSRLYGPLLPREPNKGVVVIFDRVDYFFFYDKNGVFRARRLIDKPPWYSVAGTINLEEHLESWHPVVQEFLVEQNIGSHDVIFSTGDLDVGAIPFLYINTRDKVVVVVQQSDIPDDIAESPPGGHALRTVWHVAKSNTYTAVIRPFSTVQALVSVAQDTTIEFVRQLAPEPLPTTPAPPLTNGPLMDIAEWEACLDDTLGRPAVDGRLEFLVGGAAFFSRFIDSVTSAEESVDIRTYIFDNDDVALSVAELLRRRSREGIDVRVLFDGFGSVSAAGKDSDTEPEHHKAPGSIGAFLEQDSRVRVRVVKKPLMTGDHVKTMIVDRELAFVGGMNIGREYRYDWHDLMVEVTGPVVDQLNREFRQAWGHAGPWGDFSWFTNWASFDHNAQNHPGGYPVRVIYTKPGREEIFRVQHEAIRRAQRYIYIQNAYFTDDHLLRELILARHRGVDVRVIIPLETDSGLITRNMALAANKMLKHGIRVYIYPIFSHTKAAIFDGWASVGSANLDHLSLRINRELNLATSEPEAVNALKEQLFMRDFARSTELTEPFRQRLSDHLIELFGDYFF